MSMIQKQIEQLKNLVADFRIRCDADETFNREFGFMPYVLNRAAETIEQLSAKLTASNMNDGWIPITEALPSDKDLVLVSYRIEEESQVDISTYSDKYGFNLSPHVTAWMELPELYEPKEERL